MSEQATEFGIMCLDSYLDSDGVHCINTGHKSPLTIPIKDILCVLPSNNNAAYPHTLLFLRDDIGFPSEIDRIHLKSTPSALLSSHLLTELPHYLCHSSNPSLKLHVIISSGSGTGTARVLFGRLQRLFRWVGVDQYEVHETQSPRTITDLCHSLFIPQAEAGVPQTIIVLSGDGGICDIIDSFHGTAKMNHTPPNIGLIPAGTGNALASSTGLAANPATALTALLRGRLAPLPVFVATFSHGAGYIQGGQSQPPAADENCALKIYGGVVASWGLHAALVADSDTTEYRKFGADRFKMAAKELLYPSDASETHKYKGTITLIRRDIQHNAYEEVLQPKEHMYVLVTLVSNLEKDFMISPESSPLDGVLRFLRFGPVPPQQAMQLLAAAYQNGRHVEDEEVMYSEIEEFKIDFHETDERWRRVCVDGKVIIVKEHGWMKVQKEKRHLMNIILNSRE
ncbi:diacylglycerol/lipid kinase family protein [Aspergillus undulatus]|uniref:diacylglycerol/lipid kinase family protein n=1 Tax=Aspergillus undulatus TaxID=1810928 RepID=UPI003CCDAE29